MSFLKKYYSHIILTIIFFLGLAIRLYNLNLNAPELYADETGGSYQMLQTIKTSTNPITQIVYRTSTLVWLLGLNPFGVRVGSAIYGTLLLFAVYFFAKKVSNSKIALISSFLAAIIPAFFILSRFAAPQILIITILVCIHAGLFLQAKKISSYILSFLPIAISFFYYPSFVVFTPIIMALTFIYIFKLADKKQRQILITSSVIFFIAFTLIYLFKLGGINPSSRGLDLAIWNDVNVTATHNLYRGIAGESNATKLIYNKPLSIGRNFVLNYASFFSPDWLFFTGDPVRRHSTGMVGTFFPILAPFLIYGAFNLFKNHKVSSKTKIFFTVWILISPIPAALTTDGAGYLLRVVTIVPFLVFLSAYGIISMYQLFKPRIFKTIYILFISFTLIFSVYTFLYGYFKVYPKLSSTAQSFEYGFKDLSDFQAENQNASMLIVWQGFYPDYTFRFWQQTSFNKTFKRKKIASGDSVFYQTFDNLFFAWPASKNDLDTFLSKYQSNIDYLIYPSNYLIRNPEYLLLTEPVKVIINPDGKPSFTIYKIN